MFPVNLILLVAAFLCCLISAFGVNPPRCNLLNVGIALFILTFIIGK